MKKIESFHGDYRFLSNFWMCDITMDGVLYPCVENAYQAAKCRNKADRNTFRDLLPHEAKRLSHKINIRQDWESIKVEVMKELIDQKFDIPYLREKLLETGTAELIEGNTWGDTFWGVCGGQGKNVLGRLLMDKRSRINASMNVNYTC